MEIWLALVTLRRRIVFTPMLLLIMVTSGCTPGIGKFQVSIPSAPPAQAPGNTQGTTHVCPASSVQLAWTASGHVSLSATEGPRYQTPACLAESTLPSQGTRAYATDNHGSIQSCNNDIVFRITASHSFWRRLGPCPGSGCPNADREIIVADALQVPVGNRTDTCANDGYQVQDSISTTNWDPGYAIDTVTLEGSPEVNTLKAAPDRTLTVSHDGKQALFKIGSETSDVFRGTKITGGWVLRLSGCVSAPPALTVTVKLSCTK